MRCDGDGDVSCDSEQNRMIVVFALVVLWDFFV
jgi:hypothetical protein